MSTARFIVCEKTGKWAAAFRRALRSGEPRVYETRTLHDMRDLLEAHPASFVALEAHAGNLAPLCRMLVDIRQEFHRAAAIVVTQRGHSQCRWLLREAGAAYVVDSPRRLSPLVQMARKHIAAAPAAEPTLRDTLLRDLPWSEFAAT